MSSAAILQNNSLSQLEVHQYQYPKPGDTMWHEPSDSDLDAFHDHHMIKAKEAALLKYKASS